MLMALLIVGREAKHSGATLYLESQDGKMKKKITADNVVALVQQAEGFDNNNDAWLVVERKC